MKTATTKKGKKQEHQNKCKLFGKTRIWVRLQNKKTMTCN